MGNRKITVFWTPKTVAERTLCMIVGGYVSEILFEGTCLDMSVFYQLKGEQSNVIKYYSLYNVERTFIQEIDSNLKGS